MYSMIVVCALFEVVKFVTILLKDMF